MDSYHTKEEVLEITHYLLENMEETSEKHSKRRETIKNRCLTQLKKTSKNREFQKAFDELVNVECKAQDDIKNTSEDNVHIQTLKNNLSKKKERESVKEKEHLQLEKEVKKIKKKNQSTHDDRENINMKKDIILAYKLLTNTKFIYNTKKVTGVVMNTSPKTFNFNPEDLSQKEITHHLRHLAFKDRK